MENNFFEVGSRDDTNSWSKFASLGGCAHLKELSLEVEPPPPVVVVWAPHPTGCFLVAFHWKFFWACVTPRRTHVGHPEHTGETM